MTSSGTIQVRLGYKWIALLLFTCALSLLTVTPAQAQSSYPCDTPPYNGVIDGNLGAVPPAHLDVTSNCIIRNFPASNPYSANISFYGNNPTPFLLIFDNVDFTGNMSCDKSQGNMIWFTNGSISGLKPDCQNLFVMTEKINKQNPPGPATATIGVPFTYTMTIPVLFNPITGTVVNPNGSPDNLQNITITDDLNATGVDMTLVGQPQVSFLNGPTIGYTFSNAGGVLTFKISAIQPMEQVVIQLPVVLSNTPKNAPGTQFVNTAKWTFDRLINGLPFQNLPGQWGVTPPMTIAGPPSYEFDKTVVDLTSPSNPPNTAAPGDKLRYTLRFKTTTQALNNFSIFDDIDSMNAQADFAQGSLALFSAPAGADTNNTSSTGGKWGNGVLDVRNISVPVNSQAVIQFDIILLKTGFPIGTTVVSNQATLRQANGVPFAWSDDPTVNGVADPTVQNGSEDPTRVNVISAASSDPALVMTKSGPATMTGSVPGTFGLDVQNTGGSDAWNITITDLLPQGATSGSGMCIQAPIILSAQVFATANGTPVPGKGPLSQNTDYSYSYSNCQLNLIMLTAAATISPTQHLIISYRTQLDANAPAGATLTNVAGAVQWFNADSSNNSRKSFTGALSNGTPGVTDNQDAHTVTVPGATYEFDKTVVDLTNPNTPAETAAPGDKLQYTLRFKTTTQALNNFSIVDDMDSLNTSADFVQGSLALVSSPAGSDTSNTNANGGSKGTGIIDVRNISVPVNSQATIQFDITLKTGLNNGTVVTNQATLRQANGTTFLSDDPNVNGIADPTAPSGQDPTKVTIVAAAPTYEFDKTVADLTNPNSPANTAAPGDRLRYTLRFKTTTQALNNFSFVDDMDALNTPAYFAQGTLAIFSSPAGSDTSNTNSNGGSKGTGILDVRNISVPVNSQATIQFDITLKTPLNNGTVVTNQATLRQANGTNFLSDDPSVNGIADPTAPTGQDPTRVTIVAAAPTYEFDKTVVDLTNPNNPAETAAPGDRLRYTLRFKTTTQALNNFSFVDDMDALNTPAYFAQGTLAIFSSPAGSDTSNTNANGGSKGTGILDVRNISVPANSQAVIQFDITLKTPLNNGTVVTNQATLRQANGTNFLSDDPNVNGIADPTAPTGQDPTRVTIVAAAPTYEFDKTVVDLTNPNSPANTAAPGDRLRYTLRFKTTTQALNNFSFVDDMDALNTPAYFAQGTLAVFSSPAGSDTSNTNSNGGSKGTGILDVRNISVPVNSQATIQFDITLKTGLNNGTVVTNQATLRQANGTNFLSDDPSVNGIADPTAPTGQDPTRVTIVAAAPTYEFDKTVVDLTNPNSPAETAAPGDRLRYTLRFKTTTQALNNFSFVDDMDALNTPAYFAQGTLALVSSPAGSDTSNTNANGGSKGTGILDVRNISVPVNSQATIQFDITLKTGLNNGTVVTNQATLRQANGTTFLSDDPNVNGIADPTAPAGQDPTRVTIVAAAPTYEFDKTVVDLTNPNSPANTAAPGDRLRYTLRFKTTTQALNNFSFVDDMDSLNTPAYFAQGTLAVFSSPAGSDTSNTNSNGGSKGTGILDVRNISVPVNSQAVIQFDITLKTPLNNGTIVTNQATLRQANGTNFLSDDPNVNGIADPTAATGQDPTKVTIVAAAPTYEFDKTVVDLTNPNSPANTAAPGDRLRYTLRFKTTTQALNNFSFVDDMDALNTPAYFAQGTLAIFSSPAGSDTSNTNSNGGSKGTGILDVRNISVPVNSQAVIQFDITLKTPLNNGTVVTNQATLRQANGTTFLSDDPNVNGIADPTAATGQDPTRVTIVAAAPTYEFDKTVVDLTNPNSPAETAAPGDRLRYTLRFKTTTQALNNFSFVDDMDALNTPAYFAQGTLAIFSSPAGSDTSNTNSNGGSKGTGILDVRNISVPVNSQATIQFDITLKTPLNNGTIVTNQATLRQANGTNFLSDDPSVNGIADPTAATGQDPTKVTIVIGGVQQLSITNQVSVVGGGPAIPGSQLDYVLTITNAAAVPASNVVITDDASQPGQLTYVNSSATLNGAATGLSFASPTITANYSAVNGTLAPGATVVVKFRTTLDPNLALGTVVTNTGVAAWNTPPQTTSASVSIVVGSAPPAPGLGILSGSLWYDANFDGVQDSGEPVLAGWTVQLYSNNQLSQSVVTDNNGAYSISGVQANAQAGVRPQLQRAQSGVIYELRFLAPNAGANTAMLGRAQSPFTNGLQRISDIVVPSGGSVQGLNLPIHPNGVVYNSIARTAIAGATLSLLDARSSSPLPAACFDDPAQQGQITLVDGYYRFDINFSDPACPSGGDYLIGISAPAGSNYVAGYSQIILPKSSASTAAFSVSTCPGSAADAIPSTAQFCEAQPSDLAPVVSVLAGSPGTNYYIHLMLDNRQIPGSSEIFNNHIPLDPLVVGSLTITKTTPLLNVTRGQLVPYTITANNHSGQAITDVTIVDRLPAGFSYIKGSALLDGVPTEPSVVAGTLSWNGLVITGTQTRTLKLLVAVGAGGSEGEYINRAQALNSVSGFALSGEATATVRLIPDPTFDCTDVIGKVFNDKNRNGRQDDGEEGLAGVRVVTPTGLQATTDKYGRYHITCAIVPNESRGSNVVLKLDDRTLPSGFRMSTDQLQIQRATSGKALTVNFAASIHRVVAIDLSDAAFEPGTNEMRVQWKARLDLLLAELRKAPSVLRLSYVADTEDEALVKRRMDTVKQLLTEEWNAGDHSYTLAIEPEVFWRRGAPPKRPNARPQER